MDSINTDLHEMTLACLTSAALVELEPRNPKERSNYPGATLKELVTKTQEVARRTTSPDPSHANIRLQPLAIINYLYVMQDRGDIIVNNGRYRLSDKRREDYKHIPLFMMQDLAPVEVVSRHYEH